ncbi:hypothetical protein [Fastidiosibacter lacustris]|uniref:hypothetical protein n=1 Tax=Fastidiosibacter lacustris TaxID=2056695 RepID=UPI000E3413DF|nr:hypothetical protein [Fastidiosibacter lacustris]
MVSGKFLLTFDWVVNCLKSFNQTQPKDKKIAERLRYIVKLATARGCKSSAHFFERLCQVSLSITEIRKSTKHLASFVSPDEMKILLSTA